MASNYSSIPASEATPLKAESSAASAADIPFSNPNRMVRTVFGSDYPSYPIHEKAATLITTNRHKRPVFSLVLGTVFAMLVVTLSLCLIRGYHTYSGFRATHDIPRRVNITAMVDGSYYYSSYSDYSYTTTESYTSSYSTFSTIYGPVPTYTP
ncbi:uncharacterized protein V1518DRAFT_429307 [Limtongia smithiae]|uniref:uncharacterized protein n=1 Tax=Limtongia smithiae TaxID=1125753 RepID=UPI0034CF3C8A